MVDAERERGDITTITRTTILRTTTTTTKNSKSTTIKTTSQLLINPSHRLLKIYLAEEDGAKDEETEVGDEEEHNRNIHGDS